MFALLYVYKMVAVIQKKKYKISSVIPRLDILYVATVIVQYMYCSVYSQLLKLSTGDSPTPVTLSAVRVT
jgi:hypothetical protein